MVHFGRFRGGIGLGEIEVGDDEIVIELSAGGDGLAAGVEDHARAVKDEFILPSDHVDVAEEDAVGGGTFLEHGLTDGALAAVVGGAVDVDDGLGAGGFLDVCGAFRHPDVFTDVDADARAADLIDGALIAGGEVAFLIKDAVVGEEYLAVDVDEFAIVDDGGGVVYFAVRDVGWLVYWVWEPRSGGGGSWSSTLRDADDDGDVGGRLDDLLEGIGGGGEE